MMIEICYSSPHNCAKSSNEMELLAYNFHKSIPTYSQSPLYALSNLAELTGVKEILLKDESVRFNLKAFKILGAAWAMAYYLADHYKFNTTHLTYVQINELLKNEAPLTFVTATDGNHGRGVAHAASWFNQKAVIYLPKGSSAHRVKAIIDEGAIAKVLDVNYDDTVRYAKKMAIKNNWILLQDTAFENYTFIPQLIMQGYQSIIHEIKQQHPTPPTHLILQAGVGSFAAAIITAFFEVYKFKPIIIIVEPKNANCYYHSALMQDGLPHNVGGDLNTIMAGLSCGEPNPLAWEIISKSANAYVSVEDGITKIGMRRLANPLGDDNTIIAGESGAVGIGLLEEICLNNNYQAIKNNLQINKSSSILCINTEGATNPESYKRIVYGLKN